MSDGGKNCKTDVRVLYEYVNHTTHEYGRPLHVRGQNESQTLQLKSRDGKKMY